MSLRSRISPFTRTLTLLISGLVVLTVSTAPAAMAAATLDQGTTFKGDGWYLGVDSSQSMAQIFTAGISGSLTEVSLGIAKSGTVTNLTIGIYQAASGIPTGSALASTTITDLSGMATGQVMFDVDFASPTAVTAGSTYAIVATTTDSSFGMGGYYLWYNTSAYGGGAAASDTGSGWTAGTYILTFSTYVLVSSSSSTSESSAPRDETLSFNSDSSGATCTSSGQSATGGTWLTLPGANDCTPPASKAGATLLGWSTTPDFPIAIAQRQVTNGWGTYETFNDAGRITAVFIPAGRATFLSGTNNLYAIWDK